MDAIAHYAQVQRTLTPVPDWRGGFRALGLKRLRETGFPGRRDEAWKYTNAEKILGTPFQLGRSQVDALPERALALTGGPVLVLVDGGFASDLSRLDVPADVTFAALSGSLGPEVRDRVGSVLTDPTGFDALNLALIDDGAVVRFPRDVVPPPVLHIAHITTGRERLAPVRVVIQADTHHPVMVVEHWLSSGEGPSLTNAVTEIEVGPGATLHHLRVQDEGAAAHHVGTVAARVQRDATLHSHVVSLGARINRVDLRVDLVGSGAEVHMNGLTLARDAQHADHHTSVDHSVGHTVSREHYKSVLADRARGVFTGRIAVRPDAQRIDSAQENHNLLLSDDAVANTRPQLEIFADDVKCAHGATIGRLDADAEFYLRARGIGEQEARGLLTFAFANEVLSRLPDGGVRDVLEERARRWLEPG